MDGCPKCCTPVLVNSRAAWLTAGGIAVGVIGSLIIPSRVNSQTTPSSYIDVHCDGRSGLSINGFVANSQIFAVAVIGIVRVSSVPMAMLLLMSSRSVPGARMGVAGDCFSLPVNLGSVRTLDHWCCPPNSADFGSSVTILSVICGSLSIRMLAVLEIGFLQDA